MSDVMIWLNGWMDGWNRRDSVDGVQGRPFFCN